MAMHLGRSLRRALSLSSTFAPAAESSLVQREVLSNQVFSLNGRNCSVDGLGKRMLARGFASGSGEEVVHEGLKLHATGGWHKAVGTSMAGVMWFWVFYRFYHDYEGFLFGHAQHFEHELHEHDHQKNEK